MTIAVIKRARGVVIKSGINSAEVRRQAELARTETEADRAETNAAFAEEFSGPAYSSQAAGEAATTEGQFFRVPVGTTPETYTRYQRTAGGSVEAASLVPSSVLSSASGSANLGTEQGITAQEMFNRLVALGGVYAEDYDTLQEAVTYAQSNDLGYVILGPGDTELSTTTDLDTQGIAIVGASQPAPQQSGSGDKQPSQLVWTGGASPMFSTATTRCAFIGFTVRNEGTATDFLEMNSGSQEILMRDLSFLVPSGSTAFSRSIVRSNGNRLGYSVFDNVRAKSAAPRVVDCDGQGTSNGITWLEFKNHCQFDASTLDMTVLYVRDETFERVFFDETTTCITNGTSALTIVNTTDDESATPSVGRINVLDFRGEIDQSVSGDATDRWFKLRNIDNFIFSGCHVNAGGVLTAVGTLHATNLVECRGNYLTSINGPLFDEGMAFTSGGTTAIAVGNTITGATSGHTAKVQRVVVTSGSWAGGDAAGYLAVTDATGPFAASENLDVGGSTNLATVTAELSSTAIVGTNFADWSDTNSIFTNRTMGIEKLPYAATINVGLKHGNIKHHQFEVDVTNNTNFTLTFRNQRPYPHPVPDTLFTYTIRNKSGGAMGASQIRFNNAHTLVGGGITLGVSPANGFQRSITFLWDGIKAVEQYRSPGDVAVS